MIEGWDVGIEGMREGGLRTLTIPARAGAHSGDNVHEGVARGLGVMERLCMGVWHEGGIMRMRAWRHGENV